MIDRDTGAVRMAELTIAPAMTRKKFLSSKVGRQARHLVINEPWHSWVVGDVAYGKGSFGVVVMFEGERLDAIWLSYADGAGYSTDAELKSGQAPLRPLAARGLRPAGRVRTCVGNGRVVYRCARR